MPTTAPGATAPGTPLVITGTPAGTGATTALVIDARNLPSGSEIQLQNVEFAAVIGAVRVTGGDGHDVIADFNAAEGDRILLRSGLTYTLAANGAGDAVIVFSNNDDVTLTGVRRDQVQSTWFVTG